MHGYSFPVFLEQAICFRICLLNRRYLNGKIILSNLLSYTSHTMLTVLFRLDLPLKYEIQIPLSACVCINKSRFAPGLCLHCHVCKRQCKQTWVESELVPTWAEPRLVGVSANGALISKKVSVEFHDIPL